MQPGDQLSWYFFHFINTLFPYAVAAVGIALISVTPLGRATISWLKGHINRGRAAELAAEIEHLRLELSEAQERLDFAERRLFSSGLSSQPEGRVVEPLPESRIPTPV